MLCVGWGCGGVNVLPLLGGFSCNVYLQHLSRFYFRKHVFCFLPLATILESSICFFFILLMWCVTLIDWFSLCMYLYIYIYSCIYTYILSFSIILDLSSWFHLPLQPCLQPNSFSYDEPPSISGINPTCLWSIILLLFWFASILSGIFAFSNWGQ
jgi:hypothetical protein